MIFIEVHFTLGKYIPIHIIIILTEYDPKTLTNKQKYTLQVIFIRPIS